MLRTFKEFGFVCLVFVLFFPDVPWDGLMGVEDIMGLSLSREFSVSNKFDKDMDDRGCP